MPTEGTEKQDVENRNDVDVVAFHNEFFNVLSRAFPHLIDLHYGLTPASEHGSSLRGMMGRIARGQTRLLEAVVDESGMSDWPASSRGLDMGCGLAGTSIYLSNRFGFPMTGLNINGDQAQMAQGRISRHGQGKSIAVVQADATAMPFQEGSLDFIVAIEIAFHVRDKATLIREAARVLKPGGRLLLVDEEWSEAVQVGELMFYPAAGTYGKLATDAGLAVEREVDLSADVARWMEDYSRSSSPMANAAAVALTVLKGKPRLAWKFARGLSFFNRMVLEDVRSRGVDVSTIPPWGAIQRLRTYLADELASGRARHILFVMLKPGK